jgi:low temperature requirement protein LtrA
LKTIPAVALVGGVALYLFALVAFRWRMVQTTGWQRLVGAAAALALYPVAREVPAVVSLALVFAVPCAVILYEVIRFAETRDHVRHHIARGHASE